MKKRQLIMEKAFELFSRQGFEATSVQQITDYCGISKGAFYLSFKSKDELINAIIDDFNQQISAQIDYTVKNAPKDKLLLSFYEKMYSIFQRYSDFGMVMMKEMTQPLNQELVHKLKQYNQLIDESILFMLKRLYGDDILETQYDLVYCVKGFISSFTEIFFIHSLSIDLQSLCQSLTEKTEILARQSKKFCVTKDDFEAIHGSFVKEITKEKIFAVIDEVTEETDDCLENESLLLLKEQIEMENVQQAIIIGLLGNIKDHPKGKWIDYLVREFLQLRHCR